LVNHVITRVFGPDRAALLVEGIDQGGVIPN
jgi:hypothetical protein